MAFLSQIDSSSPIVLEDSSLGDYLLSHFLIRIKGDVPRDENGNVPVTPDTATLWHEYFHFLTDVSTTFGQTLQFLQLSALQWVPYKMWDTGLVDIQEHLKPLKPKALEEWIKSHRSALRVLLGTAELMRDEDPDLVRQAILREPITRSNYEIKVLDQSASVSIPGIRVPGSKYGGFNIGGTILFEGLATLLEQRLGEIGFPIEPAPYVPYWVAQTLGERFGCTSRSHLAVLCDQALMTLMAGDAFVALLEAYEKGEWSTLSPGRVARECRKAIGDQQDANQRDILAMAQANTNAQVQFPKEAIQWYWDKCIKQSIALRKQSRTTFIAPILADRPDSALRQLSTFMPSSTVVPRGYEISDHPEHVVEALTLGGDPSALKYPQFFAGLLHMASVIERFPGNPGNCPSWTFCSLLKMKDKECNSAPWRKGGEGKMCHIGAANRYLGIIPPSS